MNQLDYTPQDLQCANCPFARHLGGNRYSCSSNHRLPEQKIVYGHHEADDQCYRELRKARDREDEYQNHFINDASDKLGKILQSEVPTQNLEWFWQWQAEQEQQDESEDEQDKAQNEFDCYLELQAEVTVLQDWAKSEQLELTISYQELGFIPIIKVNDCSQIYKQKVADVMLKDGWWIANGKEKDRAEATTLKDAIAPLLKRYRMYHRKLEVAY